MTRIIVPISVKDNFRFDIYSEGIVRKIEKIFGAQDIDIGYQLFDKAFITKSNNEFKVKSLLGNTSIRNLLLKQNDINLQILIKREFGNNNFQKMNMNSPIVMAKFKILISK